MPYHPLHHRRVILLAVVLLLVVAIGQSDVLQGALHDVLAVVERLIRAYPRAGLVLFRDADGEPLGPNPKGHAYEAIGPVELLPLHAVAHG